jgi:ribosomal protein L14E/L6E/L27E
MDFERGQIVVSRAGHDQGKLYCVMGKDGEFLLLADGKSRKTDRPKRKKQKHVNHAGRSEHPAIQAISSGKPVPDSALRRALAAFRDEFNKSDQGGNKLGKE